MTMHDSDRPVDDAPVEETDELGDRDVLTDEQDVPAADTDLDVAEPELAQPGDDEPDTDLDVADLDEPADDEPGTDLDVADVGEPGDGESDAAWSREDTVAEDTVDEPAPGSDPRDRLAPVGPDAAVDPGTGSYQDRWGAIQAGFIDDPGRTVESASALLAEIGDEIARSIAGEREGIDHRWRTTESSTDDLRVAMQDYRTLYGRLTQFTSGA
jgi:hypothetical protein